MIKSTYFLAWAQETADITQQTTLVYQDGRVVRLCMKGWPMQGTLLATVRPQYRPSRTDQ